MDDIDNRSMTEKVTDKIGEVKDKIVDMITPEDSKKNERIEEMKHNTDVKGGKYRLDDPGDKNFRVKYTDPANETPLAAKAQNTMRDYQNQENEETTVGDKMYEDDKYRKEATDPISPTAKDIKKGDRDTWKNAMQDDAMDKARDMKDMKEGTKDMKNANEGAKDAWNTMKDGAKEMKEGAKDAWNNMKDGAKEMKEGAKDAWRQSSEDNAMHMNMRDRSMNMSDKNQQDWKQDNSMSKDRNMDMKDMKEKSYSNEATWKQSGNKMNESNNSMNMKDRNQDWKQDSSMNRNQDKSMKDRNQDSSMSKNKDSKWADDMKASVKDMADEWKQDQINTRDTSYQNMNMKDNSKDPWNKSGDKARDMKDSSKDSWQQGNKDMKDTWSEGTKDMKDRNKDMKDSMKDSSKDSWAKGDKAKDMKDTSEEPWQQAGDKARDLRVDANKSMRDLGDKSKEKKDEGEAGERWNKAADIHNMQKDNWNVNSNTQKGAWKESTSNMKKEGINETLQKSGEKGKDLNEGSKDQWKNPGDKSRVVTDVTADDLTEENTVYAGKDNMKTRKGDDKEMGKSKADKAFTSDAVDKSKGFTSEKEKQRKSPKDIEHGD